MHTNRNNTGYLYRVMHVICTKYINIKLRGVLIMNKTDTEDITAPLFLVLNS